MDGINNNVNLNMISFICYVFGRDNDYIINVLYSVMFERHRHQKGGAKMSTASGVPKRSPIQVLTRPNVA